VPTWKSASRLAAPTPLAATPFPVELQNMLVRSMKAWGPMYDGAIVSELNTSSGNALPIPTTDDTGNTGVAGTEGTALTDDGSADATFGQKQLEAYDFNTKFVKFSWQLAQDSIFNMESLLADLLGERLGRLANAAAYDRHRLVSAERHCYRILARQDRGFGHRDCL
jgi:HK97 family phage major capsid protein